MKNFIKNMIPGIWLILALPLAALLFLPLDRFINMGTDFQDGGFVLIFLFSHTITGLLWSRSLLRRTGRQVNTIAGLTAGLVFGLSVVGVYWIFEPVFDPLIRLIGAKGIEHLEFRTIFVTWTALTTGATGLALGLALKDWRLALRLLTAGLVTGGGTFLMVAVMMDAAGFRVGTPRPDGLPSMPIITVTGIWLAALLGSGVFSLILENPHPEDTAAQIPSPEPQINPSTAP